MNHFSTFFIKEFCPIRDCKTYETKVSLHLIDLELDDVGVKNHLQIHSNHESFYLPETAILNFELSQDQKYKVLVSRELKDQNTSLRRQDYACRAV